MFCGHSIHPPMPRCTVPVLYISSYLVLYVSSTHTRLPCPLVLLVTALLTLVVTTTATKLTTVNKNTKKARVARARHAAAQRNDRTAPVAPPLRPRRSARGSCRITPEGSDGSHPEGPPEGLGRQQSRPSSPEPEDLNPAVPDIEALRATHVMHSKCRLLRRLVRAKSRQKFDNSRIKWPGFASI